MHKFLATTYIPYLSSVPNYISPNFQNCLTQVARHLRRVEPARDSRRLQRSPQHPHVHPGVQRSVRTESISQQISLNMIFCRHHKQGWANERLLSCQNILLGWVWWYIAKQDLGPFFHSCLYAWWKRLALGCVNITQPRVQLSNHPCLYVKSDLIIGTVRVSTSFSRRARPWPAPPSWASCSASCRRSRPAKEGQLRIWKLTQPLTKIFGQQSNSIYFLQNARHAGHPPARRPRYHSPHRHCRWICHRWFATDFVKNVKPRLRDSKW